MKYRSPTTLSLDEQYPFSYPDLERAGKRLKEALRIAMKKINMKR